MYDNASKTNHTRRSPRELRRTNYTVPTEFSLIPNITITRPTANKCWADGSCANNPNPNKADVFGSAVKNGIPAPIKIPGVNGVNGIRPNSPEYEGRFGDLNNLEYECGDGTEECENACCSYGFCIDPTNECTPYTAKASFYSLYTFISLAAFCIVYWVLFWWFGVEYAKQATIIHPEFSRDKIAVDNMNIMQQKQPHMQVPIEIDSKDNTVRSDKKDVTISKGSKDVSLDGGIFPDKNDSYINEKQF